MGVMQVPRRVDYGLRAVIYLASQNPDRSCSVGEIASQQGIPRKFLEKIIQDLIRSGVVRSKRGPDGGYSLARPPAEISFRDVIEAVEGPIAVNVCMDQNLRCDHMPRCAMFNVWNEVQRKVVDIFANTTLANFRSSSSPAGLNASSLSSAA